MKYYIFTVTLGDYGETPEEAWNSAVASFCDDPGEWESYTEEEVE